METKESLEKIKQIIDNKVNLKKSPRVNRNYQIIKLILDGFSYAEIGDKIDVSRQAVGDVVNNSKKIFLKV